MAEEVFADSQGWIALLNRSDEYHAAARKAMKAIASQRRPIVTTDWILAETGNGLARTNARGRFVEAVRRLQKSRSVTIVKIGEGHLEQALELYGRAGDKQWGLVDCASFVVMGDRGARDVFANDRHFHQAGFRCLL